MQAATTSRPRPCALVFVPALGVLLPLKSWITGLALQFPLPWPPPRLQGKRHWVVQNPPVGLPAGSAGKSWDNSPQRSVSWMPQQSGLNLRPNCSALCPTQMLQLNPLRRKPRYHFPSERGMCSLRGLEGLAEQIPRNTHCQPAGQVLLGQDPACVLGLEACLVPLLEKVHLSSKAKCKAGDYLVRVSGLCSCQSPAAELGTDRPG